MWKKPIAGAFVIGILMTGCNTEESQDNTQQNNVYDPLETTEQRNNDTERNELRRGAPDRIKRNAEEEMRDTTYNITNRAHDNNYFNEESMAITRSVNELPQVVTSQTIASEERVLIAVVPTVYARRKEPDIADIVREKVVEVAGDKEIVVYLNRSDWEQLKDLNARVGAEKAPEKIKKEINNFLQRFQPDNAK